MARRQPGPADLSAWVERLVALLVPEGVPPISARVLGWLIVCEPAEQSADQIGPAIGASRASMTTNLRLLTAMGMVTRRTRPGERTAYYHVADDAWRTIIQRQVDAVTAYVDLARSGLDLLGADTARAGRTRDLHDVFTWMARVFADAPPLPPRAKD